MAEPIVLPTHSRKKTSANQTFCCCCRNTAICIATAIIIIGVVLYFLFPAVPTVQVGNLFIPSGTNGLTVSTSSPSISNPTLNLELALASNVSVYSPAYINIGIRSITLDVTLKNSAGIELPNIAAQGVYSNLKIVQRDTTSFTIPINIAYTARIISNGLKDPVLAALQEACLSEPQKKLNAHSIVTLDISAISWLGIYPKIQNDVPVDCPAANIVESIICSDVIRDQCAAVHSETPPFHTLLYSRIRNGMNENQNQKNEYQQQQLREQQNQCVNSLQDRQYHSYHNQNLISENKQGNNIQNQIKNDNPVYVEAPATHTAIFWRRKSEPETNNPGLHQTSSQNFQNYPSAEILGADESALMAEIDKDLPPVPPSNHLDESTYNEYASSQIYYPPTNNGKYQSPTYEGFQSSLNADYPFTIHRDYQSNFQGHYSTNVNGASERYSISNQHQSYQPQQPFYNSNQNLSYHQQEPIYTSNQNYYPRRSIISNTEQQPNIIPPHKAMSTDTLVLQNQNDGTFRRQSKLDGVIRPQRKYCFCFWQKKNCIIFFSLLFVLLLILLFLALPFQFFKFDASDPFLPTDSSGSGFQIASASPLALSIMIGENITVTSPSYFTWGVHQLNVEMNLKDLNDNIIPGLVGVGYQQNLRFPARSTTVFSLPILLNYNSSVSANNFVMQRDPLYLTLQRCMQANPQLKFRLKVSLDISAISWTGWNPSVKLDLNRNCPKGIGALLQTLSQN